MYNIKTIFRGAAGTYEITNHILTFGLDILWRRKAAIRALDSGGRFWLDLCSGTGDMAISLRRFAPDGVSIVASDITMAMLEKAASNPGAKMIRFCIADSGDLPFPDNTFDLVTISFATRNLNVTRDELLRYFCEFNRVLKPGGTFINLETSQPRSSVIRYLFHAYIKIFVAPIGYMISGSRVAYKYLSYTMPRFYTAEQLSDILLEAGFTKVGFTRMTFGISALHTAVKIQ